VRDPDAELVRRVGAGDSGAAITLVRRHYGRMMNLARRMLGDASEAEDVAQEVFARVWRSASAWREGEAKFETWMHRVATNLCLDRLRRRRETLDPDAGAFEIDPAIGAHDAMEAQETAALVRDALATLPERQRTAIVLCHFQGLSNIDAAQAMEISVEACESLLARARRALRSKLLPMVQEEGKSPGDFG
jgi:RNA polymerase sigma-70 factor (ECF subfamily)